VFHEKYDKVLSDYYKYIVNLMVKQLAKIDLKGVLLIDIDRPVLSSIFPPFFKIKLQIEHTLAKTGARDSEGAVIGGIPILNDDNNYLVRITKFADLLESDLVVEYSKINEANIKSVPQLASYQSKAFCIRPALYDLRTQHFEISQKREFETITLFGNPNQGRRKTFIESLKKANVVSQNINKCFDDVESLYLNTKIIINIRQTDSHDTLEELRILPALRCGVIVISEEAPLVRLSRYSQYVIWGNLDELPKLILEVQANYEYWHKKIFGASGFLKRMERISKCNELVSLKAIGSLVDHKDRRG